MVQERATHMAEERARSLGIPLRHLLTPEEEMTREFGLAEESIARASGRAVSNWTDRH